LVYELVDKHCRNSAKSSSTQRPHSITDREMSDTMKTVRITAVLVSLLFASACSADAPTTQVLETANVRFVNWTTGLSGRGGFTSNGQFVTGSALALGQATATCATVNAGSTSFGFGAANSGGTALSGTALVALNNETISAGGDYTLVAAGPATSPTLILLSNNFSGSLGSGSAAARFISLVPSASGTTNNYVFYRGEIGAASPLALNMPFGIPSAYSIVPSGASTFSAMRTPGNVTVDPGSTLTLQPASANTIALGPNASGSAQLTRLAPCS
jgi:hypothetical protein